MTKEQALKQGFAWRDKAKPEYEATIKAQDLPDHIKDTDKSILKQVIQCQNAGHSEQSEESVSRSFANAQDDNVCQSSGVFKLIPAEYDFYQKHNIPIPRLCPDCRHQERIKQRNPMKLHHRQCQCAGHKDDSGKYANVQEHHHKGQHCPNEFETTYAPDRPEIVYCEKCYQKEVE